MARRGPKGGPPLEKRVEVKERTKTALELRLAGWSVTSIAEHLGVHVTTVSRNITNELRNIPKEAAEEYRQRQLMQLDAMMKGIWDDATAGNDWKIDRMLAILESQRKLLGLEKLAEIEALKSAQGDAGVEAESMIGTLLDGLKSAYVAQKNRETDEAEAAEDLHVDDETDE